MPNLRCLNLNYNFLPDLDGLQGMAALRKLMMVGGRLGDTGTKQVLKGLRTLEGLQEVDLRWVFPCEGVGFDHRLTDVPPLPQDESMQPQLLPSFIASGWLGVVGPGPIHGGRLNVLGRTG
jgi:hypothetical protein